MVGRVRRLWPVRVQRQQIRPAAWKPLRWLQILGFALGFESSLIGLTMVWLAVADAVPLLASGGLVWLNCCHCWPPKGESSSFGAALALVDT